MNMSRIGEKTPRNGRMTAVLDRLALGVADFSVLCEAFVTTPHPTMGKLERKKREIRRRDAALAIERGKRAAFSSYLSRLRRDGLIVKKDSGWHILPQGLKRLIALRKNTLPDPDYHDEEKRNGDVTAVIITFDIPEKERRKRHWLRSALKNIGCAMLHRSVWTGSGAVPEGFVNDLDRLGMTGYVHILSITKHGTLLPYAAPAK